MDLLIYVVLEALTLVGFQVPMFKATDNNFIRALVRMLKPQVLRASSCGRSNHAQRCRTARANETAARSIRHRVCLCRGAVEGDFAFRSGEVGDTMHFVQAGIVQIGTLRGEGGSSSSFLSVYATCKPGAYFGDGGGNFTFNIPAPGALALLGLGGFATRRRRA